MEDASHPASRILKVERSVEQSRLEEQTMTSAYERLVPIAGARIQRAYASYRSTRWRGEAPRTPEWAWGA